MERVHRHLHPLAEDRAQLVSLSINQFLDGICRQDGTGAGKLSQLEPSIILFFGI